jgi:hypothetical protein
VVVRPHIVAVRSLGQLAAALEGLVLVNLAQLQEGEAGLEADIQAGRVTYRRRDQGEQWLPLVDLRARGSGDCEDLAAAVAAEIRHTRGLRARAWPYFARPSLVHVVVKLPDGRLIDPSRTAGMVAP